jgi:hypothetical protein
MKKKLFFVLFIFFICISCFQKKSISIKYREKNQINIVKINSSNGDLNVSGWSKDSIEIITKKRIISGLPTDLKNINTKFKIEDKVFIINTEIPARINGKIDLDVYLPYTILKIIINSENDNIKIKNILSDIELSNNSGNVELDFAGNFLRINTISSYLEIKINTEETADLIINNEKGETSCLVNTIGDNSYLDINSISGNINLKINNTLDHNLCVFNKAKMLNINYNLNKELFITGNYSYLTGSVGNNKNINFYISNTNGNIIIQREHD